MAYHRAMRESLLLTLAGLLITSAALKFTRRGDFAAFIEGALQRTRLSHALALSVLLAELATAIGLLVLPSVGLVASAILFTSFALFLTAFRGRLAGAECACFGSALHSRAGPRLTARAWGLALLSVAAFALPRGHLSIAAILFWSALIIGLVFMGRDSTAGEELGQRIVLPGAPSGRVVIVFLHPDCPSCVDRGPALGALAETLGGAELRIGVLDAGDAEARSRLARRVGGTARLDHDGVAAALGIRAAPSVVVVEAGRVVASRPGASDDEVRRLASGHFEPAGEGGSIGVSRRRVLRHGLAGAGGLALASLAGLRGFGLNDLHAVALAAAGRRKPPGNDFVGSCEALRTRINELGVTDSDNESHPGKPGNTSKAASGLSGCNRRTTTTQQTSFDCPCMGRTFKTLTECKALCSSGLSCFATQCQSIVTGCCVKIVYDVCLSGGAVTTKVMTWTTPKGSTKACRAQAKGFNAKVQAHEKQHQDDFRRIFTK